MLNDGWPSKPNKGFSTPSSPSPPHSPVTWSALWLDNKLHLRLYHRRRLIILYRKKRRVRAQSPSNWPYEMVWLSLGPPPHPPVITVLGSSPAAVYYYGSWRHVEDGGPELHLHYSHVNCTSCHTALSQPVEHNQLPPMTEINSFLTCLSTVLVSKIQGGRQRKRWNEGVTSFTSIQQHIKATIFHR